MVWRTNLITRCFYFRISDFCLQISEPAAELLNALLLYWCIPCALCRNVMGISFPPPQPSITQTVSNDFRATPPRLSPSLFLILHLCQISSPTDWSPCTMMWEGGGEGSIYVYTFPEFYGLHYPKLCEIERNTVGLNPGTICSTCSRYWWLTVY